MALTGGTLSTSVLELHTLLLKASLDGGIITVMSLALFNGGHLVCVLFRENFAVLDGLD